MPLMVLVPLVVLGIGGIVLILHLLGWSRRFELASDAVVTREWLRHYPEDRIDTILCRAEAGVALVRTKAGAGVLRAFGADTVAHRVAAMQSVPDGIAIDFGEFAAPRLVVKLPEAEKRLWLGEKDFGHDG